MATTRQRKGKGAAAVAKDATPEQVSSAASDDADASPVKVTLLVDAPKQSRLQSFITRASWSLIMIFSFLFVVVYLQQPGCALLVFILQAIMYKELISLQMIEGSEADLPGFKFLYVYWFLVVSLFTYGNELQPHFMMHSLKHTVGFKLSDHFRRLSLYTFMLYSFGLILFVWSLKKKHYKYQFKQFAYCHVTLLVIVVQSSFLVSNMFKGMIWFLLPVSLVICNDIWAYIFGFFFGRTPLIKLSPKKTWEGFLGGWLATMVWGFLFSKLLARSSLMICERRGFRLLYWPECSPQHLFEYTPIEQLVGPKLFSALPSFLQGVQLQPMDEHGKLLVMVVATIGHFFLQLCVSVSDKRLTVL